jgi:hypothetical protein
MSGILLFAIGWLACGVAGAVIMHYALGRWLSWYADKPHYRVRYDAADVFIVAIAILLGPGGLFGALVNAIIWQPGDDGEDDDAPRYAPKRSTAPAIHAKSSSWTGRP